MTTIVTRVTGATAKNAPLTSVELDTNFINLNNDKLETTWTGSTNVATLGTVTTGTWNGTTIGTGYGGTGLTTFTSGGALYATSTSALTTGTLPVTAGGTGATTATGSGATVRAVSPSLVTPSLGIASATSLSTTGDITVGGNLVVSGTTTTINSTTISVDDKNIELGAVATPTDTTADGGGITLKGTTDKTFNWVATTSAWTSSEHIDLAAGKNLYLRGATSGTMIIAVPAVTGNNTITFPAVSGSVVTTGDTATVTNTMLAGSIANTKLANSTISGIALGGTLTSLTFSTTGNGAVNGTTYNGSTARIISHNSIGAAPLAGSTSIATVGTITSGTWQGADISLAYGGTNATLTAIAGGVVYSTSTAMGITNAGAAGQVLTSNGTDVPSWNFLNTISGGTLSVGGAATTGAVIRLYEGSGNGTNFVALKAPNLVTSDLTWTLPGADGTAGQALVTNGSGTLSWSAAGASIADDTSTNATYYPSLELATSGYSTSVKIASTKLYFNPSTGTLNSTTFNSLSDINQKKNVVKIKNATETLNRIEGVEFDWIENSKHSAGVIAQKLEEVLPFLVETNETGTKSVNYSGLIAYLIQSNKELSQRISALETK